MLNVDPGTITIEAHLGTVELIRLDDLDVSAGEIWYSAEAAREGFFSLEATIAGDPSDATLTLYDSTGVELRNSNETGDPQRLDWEANQGDSFLVQIVGTSSDVDLTLANLVTQTGATVTVADTAGDDRFVFSVGATQRQVTINDFVYRFFGSDGTNVLFTASDGQDKATLYDSEGDDTFKAGPDLATLSSGAYSVSVSGADNVLAYALGGGVDTAKLYDSAGDDTFVSSSTYGKLFGDDFFIRAKSFDRVLGYAKAGGNDQAKMHDSPGRDTFVATPVYAKMLRGVHDTRELSARSKFFETVYAYASDGSRDIAMLHGSDGDDTLNAWSTHADFSGQDSENRDFSIFIDGFLATKAYDNSGGFDVANLHDTKYLETFEASPTLGKLYGAKLYLRARGFDEVHAYSGFEGDVAYFQDSPGNDLFVGKAADDICKLSGEGFLVRAKAFDQVYAESTAGGTDSANLGDSSEDDLLEALDDWARISSNTGAIKYLYKVTGFDPVEATSSNGGTDISAADAGASFVNATGDWT